MDPPVIISIVADYFKVPFEEVIGTKHNREFVRARHVSMYFVSIFCNGTLDKLAEPFGKSHDDMIYARHSVNNQAWAYKEYRRELNMILSILNKEFDPEFERYKQFDTDKS